MTTIRNFAHRCPLDPAAHGTEFELLLTCSRPVTKSEEFEKQAALAVKGIDSEALLVLARRHKISSLLYCNLRMHPIGTFDSYLLDELKKTTPIKYRESTPVITSNSGSFAN